MPEFVLHPATERQLKNFISRPSHAVLIVGAEGIGKGSIVRDLSACLLDRDAKTLDKHPYLRTITPEKQAISIDAIRDLQQFTKLKIPSGSNKIQRIAVVESAELLTQEAQNALLKLLEEPPAGTILILTTTSDQALLPTIRSRSQTLNIQQPGRAELEAHFASQGFDATRIHSAYLMSGGLPGLMHALLAEDANHPLLATATLARKLLGASTFERLSAVDTLAKQRPEATRLLFVLQQMAHAALEQTAARDDATSQKAITRWQHIMQNSYDAESVLLSNGQPKLVLTNLFLNM